MPRVDFVRFILRFNSSATQNRPAQAIEARALNCFRPNYQHTKSHVPPKSNIFFLIKLCQNQIGRHTRFFFFFIFGQMKEGACYRVVSVVKIEMRTHGNQTIIVNCWRNCLSKRNYKRQHLNCKHFSHVLSLRCRLSTYDVLFGLVYINRYYTVWNLSLWGVIYKSFRNVIVSRCV